MRKRTGSWVGVLVLALLLSSPVWADEGEYQEETRTERWSAVALDVILVRPVSFGQTIAGSAFFVVAGPVAWVNGRDSFDVAYETFVETPADDTFQRELGRF
ncbi:MAG: hypothetical protein VX252_13400 [Myxococcota bacterium]|nr:hypothetical protein [Myxococcota bacterium]